MDRKQEYRFEQTAQPVIVAAPPKNDMMDYTCPRARVPGIMLLVIAFINIIAYIVLGAMSGNFMNLEFLASFGFYGILGLLAAYVGFKQQTSSGGVVAMIIFAVIVFVLACVQLIIRGLAMFTGGVLATADDQTYRTLGTLILAISGVCLIFAIIVFVLSILLVILGSQKVCQCCGAPSVGNGGEVYQEVV